MSIVNIGHNTPKWWWSVGRWRQPPWLSILVPIFFFSTGNNDLTRKGNETHERGEYAGVYLIGKCPDSFFSGEWLSPETLLLSSVLPWHSPSFRFTLNRTQQHDSFSLSRIFDFRRAATGRKEPPALLWPSSGDLSSIVASLCLSRLCSATATLSAISGSRWLAGDWTEVDGWRWRIRVRFLVAA